MSVEEIFGKLEDVDMSNVQLENDLNSNESNSSELNNMSANDFTKLAKQIASNMNSKSLGNFINNVKNIPLNVKTVKILLKFNQIKPLKFLLQNNKEDTLLPEILDVILNEISTSSRLMGIQLAQLVLSINPTNTTPATTHTDQLQNSSSAQIICPLVPMQLACNITNQHRRAQTILQSLKLKKKEKSSRSKKQYLKKQKRLLRMSKNR